MWLLLLGHPCWACAAAAPRCLLLPALLPYGRQGKRLLEPSEASQQPGRHRRPGPAHAASPRASRAAAGRAEGKEGRQRSQPWASSWQAGAARWRQGSSRAVTHPGNVLARAAAAPGAGDARRSARPAEPPRAEPAGRERRPAASAALGRGPAPAAAQRSDSPEPQRDLGIAPAGEAAQTSRSDPEKRDSGVWSSLLGLAGDPCLTPAQHPAPPFRLLE
ncbi:laforin-like [Prinia subflava]|uniref:laforin-like n=1 Tax=Prinia subflava TaxID=208062 RepID=UPI002FE12D3B